MNIPIEPDDIAELDSVLRSVTAPQPRTRSSRISLKQWRLFQAVVEYDGFVGAANTLHISQSSISHALAKLQDQLGVPLLILKGRKAHITEAGKILLERSKDLVRRAVELEELAANLGMGWEADVRLAVEPNFPSDMLMQAFHDLSLLPKKIRLSVEEAGPAEVTRLLQDGTADLTISSEITLGFVSKKLIDIEHVAVAHPGHPLFAIGRKLAFEDLRDHPQIIFSSVNQGPGADAGGRAKANPSCWKVSSLDSVIDALMYGLGYAWLPRYRIQRWLDDGRIAILPMGSGSSYLTTMYLHFGKSVTPESGASKFANALFCAADARLTGRHAGREPARTGTGPAMQEQRRA